MTEGPGDDWFSGVVPPPGPVGLPVEDDWLEDDSRSRSASPFDLRSLADRRVLVAVGIFVAFLLVVLAAAGVFSGGAPRTAATTTTTTTRAPSVTRTTTAAVRLTVGLPVTTLKLGATGAPVRLLQRALANLGYSTGAVDGQYGPATERAVGAFQKAHSLTADGVFGPKTLQALKRAVG